MKSKIEFDGKISLREMFLFLFPLLLSGLFQQIFLPFSTTISAKYLPGESLAVIGSLGACKSVENAIFVGMSTGFSFCVNREAGNENSKKYYKVFRVAFSITAAFLLFSLVLACMPDPILRIANVPNAITGEARGYLSFLLLAGGFWGVENLLLSMIQGRGKTSFTSGAVILATFIQLGSLWFMLDQFGFGIEAVSLSMVIYHLVLCIVMILFLVNADWGQEMFRSFTEKISWKEWIEEGKELTKSGAAKSMMMLMVSISFFLMQRMVNQMPIDQLAGYAHAESLNALLWQPLCVFGTASGIISARVLGNDRVDLCRYYNKHLMIYSAVWCFVLIVFVFPGVHVLIRMMAGMKANETVIQAGTLWIRIAILSYALFSLLVIFRNALQAMKAYGMLLVLGFLEMCANLLCGWVLIPMYGYTGFCIASIFRWGIPGIVAWRVYENKTK